MKDLCNYRVWDNGDMTSCATQVVKNGRCEEHLYLPDQTTGWIEVNLPWKVHVNLDLPELDHELIRGKVIAKFDYTKEELNIAFESQIGTNQYDIREEVRSEIETRDFNNKLSYEDIERMLDESDDPRMIAYRKIVSQKNEIDEFEKTIPEVIAWHNACDRIREKERELQAKKCFMDSPLNKSGVLIKIQDSETDEDGKPIPPRQYIIGDINHLAGVCDDCTAFNEDAIVLAAMILISDDDLKKIEYG
jgi:hypothetical protein